MITGDTVLTRFGRVYIVETDKERTVIAFDDCITAVFNTDEFVEDFLVH